MHKELLSGLESALVREFRLSQVLLHLTREERNALLRGDVPRLLILAERKEALLDTLTDLAELHRRAVELAARAGEDTEGWGNPEASLRLWHLLEGSRVLADQVRDLAQGNHALAAVALSRAADQQAGLFSDARSDLPALFAALLASREPPNPNDPHPAPAHPQSTLIETMTNLYHQETAYRAVLKVSSRMLGAAL